MKHGSLFRSVVLLGSTGLAACTGLTLYHFTAQAQSVHHARTSSAVVTITEEDYFTSPNQSIPMNGLISNFEKSHPGIKIQRSPVPYPQLLPKSLQQATTHSLPTILVTDNLNVPTMVAAGAITPLRKVGPVSTTDYLPGPLSTVTYQGQLYGLPLGNNDLALYYNKAMLKKAHVSPPKTWAELLVDAKKLSHGSTYGFVFSAPNNEQATWQFAPFLWTNGGSYNHFSAPKAVQALTLWTNLVKEGGASKSVVNFSQGDVYNEFAAGRAAMMEMGPWEIPPLTSTHIQYGVVPLPTPKLGQKPISPIGGEAWTISANATTTQQKAALTFIKWVQQKNILVPFDKSFGYIPAYRPAYEAFVAKNPNFAVFAKQLQSAQALYTGLKDQLPQVSTVVATAIQQALIGEASPGTAAQSAASSVSSALK